MILIMLGSYFLFSEYKLIEVLLLEEGEIYHPFLQNRDRSAISEIYYARG